MRAHDRSAVIGSGTAARTGAAVAARRTEEARCAASALGAAEPVFHDFGDGKLGEIVRPPAGSLRTLKHALAATIAAERPGIIVTWDPDGGYGQPDHRLVTAVTSEIVASQVDRPALLYAAAAFGRRDGS